MNYERLKELIQKANPEKFTCKRCGRLKIERRCQAAKHRKEPTYSLADVLLAIDEAQKGWFVWASGMFQSFTSKDGGRFESMTEKWNLKDDNLDNQSEECKQFLINLLTK